MAMAAAGTAPEQSAWHESGWRGCRGAVPWMVSRGCQIRLAGAPERDRRALHRTSTAAAEVALGRLGTAGSGGGGRAIWCGAGTCGRGSGSGGGRVGRGLAGTAGLARRAGGRRRWSRREASGLPMALRGAAAAVEAARRVVRRLAPGATVGALGAAMRAARLAMALPWLPGRGPAR